ncbi:MAG TPA: ABC transporter ATP-binding protein/permease [Candidatus Monoglobus merdigallinarum]|uniref:ABC transporter ATP-binding protein/permease n=1 Tax=Candidatus Monoglobus merdigallinarum TaxID=2838698 RepID=A0A9D1PP28_9FIRM|nr:ABC transporter ATP-binding protein/permease [Candidatus Monoglobus merdigallinarum]
MAKAPGKVEMPRMGGPKVGGVARFSNIERAKDQKGTLKRLVKVYMRFKKAIILAVTLTLLSSGISVLIPYFVGKAFNTFAPGMMEQNFGLLGLIAAVIASLYLTNWIIGTICETTMLHVSQKLVSLLRTELFEKLQRLPLSFFDSTPRGDTMSRMANDADTISSTIAQSATQLASAMLTLIGSLIIMLSLSPLLTLSVLICVPLVFLLTKAIASKSRSYFYKQQLRLGELNGIIEESIYGLKMIKAFSKEEDALKGFERVSDELRKSGTGAQTWAGYMMPLMNIINNFTFAVTATVGGILCTKYGLLIGTAVSFMTYSKQFATPLNSVAGLFNNIQSALAGAERVFEILDETEELPDAEDAISLTDVKGEIEFKDVCFSYSKNKKVLSNISFKVRPGQNIALVGETGSGKTTIVNLLTRFYDVDSGEILLDGINIKNIKRKSLEECFSVVLQDTCLFSGTIMENIKYSKPDATDAEVMNAAKLARADSFIKRLPQGYDTFVSGSRETLSEGQRQLIAISRALLCDSPILILDEATGSVDTKTEKEIQRALINLMENRTCIIIAHRLSTIRDSDKIIVINNGEICEEGTHPELLERKGRYYKMNFLKTADG